MRWYIGTGEEIVEGNRSKFAYVEGDNSQFAIKYIFHSFDI